MYNFKNSIVEMKFGSKLYELSDENSDSDFIGVYMPSLDDLLLNNRPKVANFNSNKSRNNTSDVDRKFIPFPKFIDGVIKGNTECLDMLHAPRSALLSSSPLWDSLVEVRSKAYTKEMKTFFSFIKSQAYKYGAKGRTLAVILAALKVCAAIRDKKETKLAEYIDFLPINETTFIKNKTGNHGEPQRFYSIAGRMYQDTLTFSVLEESLIGLKKTYGDRAATCALAGGIDRKALSHAFRVGYQFLSILENGDYSYPLEETELIKKVKQGEISMDEITPLLNELLKELEVKSNNSTLPEKVDAAFWRKLQLDKTKEYFNIETNN